MVIYLQSLKTKPHVGPSGQINYEEGAWKVPNPMSSYMADLNLVLKKWD